MTSHGCYLCLLLLSVILIEPSKAGCMDYFTKKGLNESLTNKLPDNITVNIMNEPEDTIVCSISNDCNQADPKETNTTCFLWDCFQYYNPPCNKTDENISVPNLHFMCLTDIAKRLHDETKPPEVCQVYKKVCGEDSATTAPPKTSPTTPTIEATPSTALPTMPTIEATASTAPTIEATPSTAPTIEATPSTPLPTAPTIEATPSTAPAIEATPTIEATTKNPSTASTTKTTSSTTSTTAASSLVNSQRKSCSEKEISSGKETGSDIQTISIVLITTNIIVPIAVYLYMRYQIQQILNLREEEGMTEIQQNPFPTDVEEGSNLLMTPESSIIINSLENTII